MSNEITRRIAYAVFESEVLNAYALGMDAADVYESSFAAMYETIELAEAPDRPAVLTRFRPMRRA